MQKDKKREHRKKVVIASVLKPVSDTRMFEKFALSLARTNQYLVFLVGFEGKYNNVYSNIRFKPLFGFSRLHPLRLLAPFTFFGYLFKVNPKIIIVQTHELLIPSLIYKLIFKTKVVYDVQENYYRNLMYSSYYFLPLKLLLVIYVSLKERICSPFINHFILAEKCYFDELSFIKKTNTTIIENKYYSFENKEFIVEKNQKIRLLFSGTIAKETGIFEAIEFARKLHKINSDVYLVIAGGCPSKSTLQKIKKIVKIKPYIKMMGGSSPMHHEDILREIKKSHFGVISYPITKVTKDRIPTKLYEYLANKLPVICSKNEAWEHLINQFNGGLVVDFSNFNSDLILEKIKNTHFFNNDIRMETLLWETEEPKLLSVIQNL